MLFTITERKPMQNLFDKKLEKKSKRFTMSSKDTENVHLITLLRRNMNMSKLLGIFTI